MLKTIDQSSVMSESFNILLRPCERNKSAKGATMNAMVKSAEVKSAKSMIDF